MSICQDLLPDPDMNISFSSLHLLTQGIGKSANQLTW